jgi:hypothetical protein
VTPIRVLIAVSALKQPAWVAHVVEEIGASAFAEIAGIVVYPPEVSRRRGLLRSIYERIDRARFGRRDDAFSQRDLSSFIPPANDTPFDVIVSIDAAVPREVADQAQYGVWTCHFDQWNAFADRGATTLCSVEADIRGRQSIIGSSRAPTDLISMRRGNSRLARRTATLLLQALEKVSNNPSIGGRPAGAADSHGGVLRAATAAAARYARQLFLDRRTVEQWHIAFRFGDDSLKLRGFHIAAPPPDRLWADPFAIQHDGRTFIFIEELVYRENRGVIAQFEVFEDGSFSPPQRVLERPYHLSYPCVFQFENEWWMLPETSENRTIELYRAVEFPHRWTAGPVLFRDVTAVDSTLFEFQGRW